MKNRNQLLKRNRDHYDRIFEIFWLPRINIQIGIWRKKRKLVNVDQVTDEEVIKIFTGPEL